LKEKFNRNRSRKIRRTRKILAEGQAGTRFRLINNMRKLAFWSFVKKRFSRLRKFPKSVLDNILLSVSFRLHEVRYIDALPVLMADSEIDPDYAVNQLRLALEKMEEVFPMRGAQFRRYVRQIVIWAGGYTAFDRWSGIHMASAHIPAEPPLLAAALVHETIHLRIARWGVPYDDRYRSRIEKICTEKQAEFLQRFSEREARMAEELTAALRDPWWSQGHLEQRVGTAFAKVGLPSWLSALFR
jgi:hypothetical protein